jgi:hypothetical protein
MSTEHQPLIDLCQKAVTLAKQEMTETGAFEAFTAISSAGEIALIEPNGERWNNPHYRDKFSELIREKIRETRAEFVVFASDIYVGRGHTDFGLEAALSLGGDIPRAHALGLTTKREAILVRGEHRDGFNCMLVQFYRREASNPRVVIWEEQQQSEGTRCDSDTAFLAGRHAGFFHERVSIHEAHKRYKAARQG